MTHPRISVQRANVSEADYRFPSIEAAFRSQAESSRAQRAAHDTQFVAGSLIERFEFTPQSVIFFLSNRAALHIFKTPLAIDWSIRFHEASLTDSCAHDYLGEECELVWPRGQINLWKRKELLEIRLGKRIDFIAAQHVNFLLYVPNLPILQFRPLFDRTHNTEFLFWNEDD